MRVLLLVLTALLSAAATDAEGTGRIYVYAQPGTPARSWQPVFCDGRPVAKIKQGKFFALEVAAGPHTLVYGKSGVPITVEVLSGQPVFVRIGWNHDLRRSPIPVLRVVAERHANKELLAVRYIDANRALSDQVARSDPREPPKLQTRGPR